LDFILFWIIYFGSSISGHLFRISCYFGFHAISDFMLFRISYYFGFHAISDLYILANIFILSQQGMLDHAPSSSPQGPATLSATAYDQCASTPGDGTTPKTPVDGLALSLTKQRDSDPSPNLPSSRFERPTFSGLPSSQVWTVETLTLCQIRLYLKRLLLMT
jgi:hypothetical protein